jgi:hypothetical protein
MVRLLGLVCSRPSLPTSAVTRSFLAALIWSLAAAAAPAVAAPWSAPSQIAGPPAGELIEPGVRFTGSGEGLAGWVTETDGAHLALAGFPAGGSVFGAAHTPNTPGLANDAARGNFALYGQSRMVLSGLGGEDGNRVVVAFGRIEGPLGRLRVIGPRPQALSTRLAADSAGDVAVAAETVEFHHGKERDRIYLMVRRAGHRFGRAVAVSPPGRMSGVALGIDPRGDILVAWERNGRVEARWRRRTGIAGGRLGRVLYLGSSAPAPALAVALGTERRAIVLWETQKVDFRSTEPHRVTPPAKVEVATAHSGGTFQRRRVLDEFSDPVPIDNCDSLRVAFARAAYTSGGEAIVAWTGRKDGHFVVRTASLEGTRFGPTQTVTQPGGDSCLSALDTSPHGDAAIASTSCPSLSLIGSGSICLVLSPHGVMSGLPAISAATRPADTHLFSGPQLIASAAASPRVAFDANTGRAVVIWKAGDERVEYATTPNDVR